MRIAVIRNQGNRALPEDEQRILEHACKRVPGVRSSVLDQGLEKERDAVRGLLRRSDETIFVVPLEIPGRQKVIQEWRRAIEAERPLSSLCAVCFVLVPHPSLSASQWLDPYWTETLDDYAELAVPSSFVVWSSAESPLKIFRIVAAVSSLVREVESLGELGRLGEQLALMEAEVRKVARRVGNPK